MRRLVLALTFASGCAASPAPWSPHGVIVDLSHAYDEQTIYWPTEDGFRLEKGFEGITDRGFYYSANRFSSPEHGGTHVDAPVHFAKGGRTVDAIPVEQLVGPAVVIDVTGPCTKGRDYLVTVADLTQWEGQHGRIPAGAIVLLSTGFARFWPDRERYLGTSERGAAAVAKLHFPGLHPDTARWLVGERAIHAVGLDTASIDHGPSTTFESHQILFAKDVPALENLTALDKLPATGATIVALPMKIRGGSGSPLRIIAFLPPH